MIKRLLLAAFLLASGTAHAQLYSKFGPVTGVLKGNVSTPQTSAAASTDIIGLWTGCTGANFLRGDGTCAIPAGVTSVGLTAPSWYTVTGSPVTGSGTLAITAATGQAANRVIATPDGTTGAVSLRALVAGDIPPINLGSTANGGVSSATILLGTNGGTSNGFFSVTGPATALRTFTFPNASATVLTSNAAVTVPQGGTGAVTLTNHGVLLGQGTSNVSAVAAMAADTLLQGQGAGADPAAVSINNCGSSSAALSYNTSTHAFGCQTISVGTGTVTNVASGTGITGGPITTTGTLSIDQSFTPTWTGLHIFDAGGGTTPSLRVGTTGAQGILCVGNSATCNTHATSGDPAHTIELVDNGGSLQGIRLLTYASGANAISPLHWARANGTQASPTAIVSNDNILSIGARGYTGSAMSGSTLGIEGIATENWSGSALGSKLQFEVVPNTGTARVPVFAMIATTSASNPSMITNGTGGTSVGYMPVIDAAGTRYGYWGKASGSNNDITYESDAGSRLVANNGTDFIHIGVATETKVNYNNVDMTPDTSSYTGTLTGITATVTGTIKLSRQGNLVCVWSDADLTGTSNTTAMTITGTLPSGFAPAANRVANVGNMQDNGVSNQINGQATMAAGGTITLGKLNTSAQTSSTNWTASGTKGINTGWTFCYPK